jgi:uncharacterized membrane protein YphA (DoxX/SURF4 family)
LRTAEDGITVPVATGGYMRFVRAAPVEVATWILRIGFTVAPIIAGVDKFFHKLVDWDQYLAPRVANMVGNVSSPHGFMQIVGVIEIIAGLGVLIFPRIFAFIVCAWLLGIIANLLMIPGYYDIALRDLGLALGALSLGILSWVRRCQ